MSNFGDVLDEFMSRRGTNGTQLARASGLEESMISRYRRGQTLEIRPDILLSIITALSNDPSEQGNLVRGHLLDECPRELRGTIDIHVRGEEEFRERLADYESEPDKIFAVLREYWDDPDVKDLLKSMASLLERGRGNYFSSADGGSSGGHALRETSEGAPPPPPRPGRAKPATKRRSR